MMKLWGHVTEINVNPPDDEMSSITVDVSGGGLSQTVTIRAGGGDSLWDALKNGLPVQVEIVSNRQALPTDQVQQEGS